ncbi:hypothetical protein [Bacillus sp. B1-b2]|uniref:hypothetical protein n=1 Tax=Bacillus sp. B1-b2 TaxID=2653201 RepID=UPI0012618542|nr:hypothetical protein [Bacillus sp. B1-b2]KAB7664902.1 hypothetical protein F9279_22385 [Bacillus sp. B1-b2]
MALSHVLVGIIKSFEETKENPKVPELKTRYYRKTRDKMIEIVQQTIKQKLPKWKLKKVDPERGEIVVSKGSSLMIITVFKMTGMQSAIDVYCSKDGFLGDFGTSYTNIQQFFKALHTEVQPEKGN